MADTSLRDRLQPSLLDRLADDERLVTVVRVTPHRDEMQRQRVSEQDIDGLLRSQGLSRLSGAAAGTLEYVAGRGLNPATLRALTLRGAGASSETALVSVCQLETVARINTQLESPERRAVSMRRLREAVLRDLGWLLNASGMDDIENLEAYPEVRRSVVNYGLRAQVGRAISSLDPAVVARGIRDSISFFEPRLSGVRVTPEEMRHPSEGLTLSFIVEAELWGRPVSQHVSLRASVDVDSTAVQVADRGARS